MSTKKEWVREEFNSSLEIIEYLNDVADNVILGPSIFKEEGKWIVIVFMYVHYY